MISVMLPASTSARLPALVSQAGERASVRFLEFFTANIRNPNMRRAYARATDEFLTWCASLGVSSLDAVTSLHVSTWIELQLQLQRLSGPSVKQRLAALRHLFDWLVVGQVVPLNPAASVRGPSHASRTGKTPVLIRARRASCWTELISAYLPAFVIEH